MALPLFHSLSHFPSCLLSSAPFFPPFPEALHLFKCFLFFPSPISCFFSFLSLSPFSIIPLITSPDLLLLALRARKFRALCFVLDGSRGFRRNQCFLPGKGASFRGRPASTLSSTALHSRSRAWPGRSQQGPSSPGIRSRIVPALGSCAASVAADGEGHLLFFLLLSERY